MIKDKKDFTSATDLEYPVTISLESVERIQQVYVGNDVGPVEETRIELSRKAGQYQPEAADSTGVAGYNVGHPQFSLTVNRAGVKPAVLHHVGIVIPNENEVASLMTLLGLEEDYRGFVSKWSVLCIFTKCNGATPIEFVIPNDGPLAKFNRGAGGLHHIAIEVPDLGFLAQELAARGIRLLENEPVRGAGNFICNFLAPAYTRGIIVEFVQLVENR